MPISVRCPNGDALKIDDRFEGKRVRCPKCKAEFVARGEAVGAGAPPKLPPRGKEVDDDQRLDDEEDEEDDRPRRRRRDEDEENEDRPRRRRRRDEEDDDEEDDDRPRKRRRDEEDEDEEDDDRPRRRRRRDEEDEDEEDDGRPRRRRRDEDDDDDDDDDDRGRGRKRGGGALKEQMQALATGLTLLGWKYLLMAACIGGIILAILVAMVGALSINIVATMGIIAVVIGIGAALCALAGLIMGIVAGCFVIKVPPKSGCKGLAIAFLSLEATYLLLSIVSSFLGPMSVPGMGHMFGPGPGGPGGMGAPPMHVSSGGSNIIQPIVGLVGLAGFVVFMILLRTLAHFLKAKAAGKSVIIVMIALIGTPLVGFGLAFAFLFLISRAGMIMAGVMAILTLGAMTFLMLWIRSIVLTLRAKID